MEELEVKSTQKKSKILNYSPEDVITLLKLYEEYGTEDIAIVAAEMGKPVRSIRSKLVSLKKYKPMEKKATTKNKGPSKKELIKQLQNLTHAEHVGLDPASKPCIEELIQLFTNAKSYE